MTYGEWELSATLHRLLVALSDAGVQDSLEDDVEPSNLLELKKAFKVARRIVDRYQLPQPGVAGRMPYFSGN
jgi:hypothetical protein